MHGDFPNKLTRKIHAEQCLALYSRLGLSAVQTSEPTSKTQGNTLLVLLCNISYHDNCVGIRIVSWKSVSLQASLLFGELYTCKGIVANQVFIVFTVQYSKKKHLTNHSNIQ